MIALVDCNNFFVSCERVVDPSLNGSPVIVLSGGDGCVVAMSNEAKRLGITRGIPLFKIRDIVKAHNVAKIRGHHDLYRKTSLKVMKTLSSIVKDIECYSIDEAFLHLSPQLGDIAGFGHYVVDEVMLKTGIPVSIGIAQTKTLAKLAARFAKKYPGYNGVCVIDTAEKQQKAIALTDISDIWGIGPRLADRLKMVGIKTAAQFASMNLAQVNTLVSITGQRTWRELNGEACIEHDYVPPERRSMTSSRSFEHDVYDFEFLRKAVIGHVSTLGRRLRRQKCHAGEISIYLRTNPFKPHLPQTRDTAKTTLPSPTSDTLTLTTAAINLLKAVYKQGYGYKKAGITLSRLIGDDEVQLGLFDDLDDFNRRRRLMDTLDRLNSSIPGAISLVPGD